MDKKERFESWLDHILVSLLGASAIVVVSVFAVMFYHSPQAFGCLFVLFLGGWFVGNRIIKYMRDVL